jgi:hypothetical protein
MEKGTLNRRGLIQLLLRQLAATALDKVGEEIMYSLSFVGLKVGQKLRHR